MASIMQSGRTPSQNLVICLLLWLVNLWVAMIRSQLVRGAKWHSAFGLLHKIFPKRHTQWNHCNSQWNGMKMWVFVHTYRNGFHLILCGNSECTRIWPSCCNVKSSVHSGCCKDSTEMWLIVEHRWRSGWEFLCKSVLSYFILWKRPVCFKS